MDGHKSTPASDQDAVSNSFPPTPDLTAPLEGSWERSGRSLNTAAIIGLLGIGALYFNAQGILAAAAMVMSRAIEGGGTASGGFAEEISELIQRAANPFRAAILVSQYLFMLLPTILLARRWHTRKLVQYFRLHRGSFLEIVLAVLNTLAIIPTGTFIANEFSRHLHIPEWLKQINLIIFTARSPAEFLWLVLVVSVTPAICEEIFFRGYVQRTLERTLGWKSPLLIGLIFGLFHMEPLGLFTLTILGILFGYFCYRSQSLYPSMAAHAANNLLVISLLYLDPVISEMHIATSETIPISWVLLTLPLAVAMLFLYQRVTESRMQTV